MKKQMILAMMASVAILAACSDDDNGSGNPGPGPAPSGVYETGLVFGEKEGSDSVYYIGNGDKHFPAPKGDYVLNASLGLHRGRIDDHDSGRYRHPGRQADSGSADYRAGRPDLRPGDRFQADRLHVGRGSRQPSAGRLGRTDPLRPRQQQ